LHIIHFCIFCIFLHTSHRKKGTGRQPQFFRHMQYNLRFVYTNLNGLNSILNQRRPKFSIKLKKITISLTCAWHSSDPACVFPLIIIQSGWIINISTEPHLGNERRTLPIKDRATQIFHFGQPLPQPQLKPQLRLRMPFILTFSFFFH
jgi:hypothetical protein